MISGSPFKLCASGEELPVSRSGVDDVLRTSLSQLPSREDCVEGMMERYRVHVIVMIGRLKNDASVLRATVLILGKPKSMLCSKAIGKL